MDCQQMASSWVASITEIGALKEIRNIGSGVETINGILAEEEHCQCETESVRVDEEWIEFLRVTHLWSQVEGATTRATIYVEIA